MLQFLWREKRFSEKIKICSGVSTLDISAKIKKTLSES